MIATPRQERKNLRAELRLPVLISQNSRAKSLYWFSGDCSQHSVTIIIRRADLRSERKRSLDIAIDNTYFLPVPLRPGTGFRVERPGAFGECQSFWCTWRRSGK